MNRNGADFWTDETSVFITSFWGWSPETWGLLSWSNAAHRDNILQKLSDPFIAVCYVTGRVKDHKLRNKIAGFYLVSHQTGDRDEFTHPIQHGHDPDKWRHGLKALRAFSYLPEQTILASELIPDLQKHGRHIGTWGKILTDKPQIQRLKDIPWVETSIYSSDAYNEHDEDWDIDVARQGMVRGGPASKGGYVVSSGTYHIPRELYVLMLKGDTSDYLGACAKGKKIYKIGLSKSPELRRRAFQAALPNGAYEWSVDRTTSESKLGSPFSFDAALAGENAMKKRLAESAEWLGGEFYLATEAEIDEAWQIGHSAARAFKRKK